MKTEAQCQRGSHTVGHYLGLLLVLFAVGGKSVWPRSLPERPEQEYQANHPEMACWVGPKTSYMVG